MKFRSGLEEKVADLLGELGVKYDYESTKVPYVIQHTYTPDFVLPNGIIIETKGLFTVDDRRKHIAIQKQHPKLDIRFVFTSSKRKLQKGSKTTYAKWAERSGFPWCSYQSIPIDWLK